MKGSKARMRLAASCGQQRLPVGGVRRLVGGGERLVGPPSSPIVERASRCRPGRYIMVAVRLDEKSSHRATASLTAVPTAHGVEAGVPDPMDGPVCMHLLVQRIRILDVLIVEQREAERHRPREVMVQAERRRPPTTAIEVCNIARRCCRAKRPRPSQTAITAPARW